MSKQPHDKCAASGSLPCHGSPTAFNAPCQNDIDMDVEPYFYQCGGTVHFQIGDIQAECDRCGARCGWAVALRPNPIFAPAWPQWENKDYPEKILDS